MLKSAKPVLTLNQFMIRGQVIKQYRDFLRTARRMPDKNAQEVKYLNFFYGLVFGCESYSRIITVHQSACYQNPSSYEMRIIYIDVFTYNKTESSTDAIA